MLSCTSLVMSTSALVGNSLTTNPLFITLPLGITYLSMMLTMIPGSLFMQRYGRRLGFSLGGFAGVGGGLAAAVGIYQGSFLLFCIGSALFGVANGFAQFYRFAAAEVVAAEDKNKAISWVLAGGIVAAFIGPNTARFTHDLIPDAVFSASYACLVIFSLGVIMIQLVIDIPRPVRSAAQAPSRPLLKILSTPTFMVAAACAMIAYGTMNLLMTATPLAMDHSGMDFNDTAMVIQWHIVGMFAPSFFTGSLIDRFGVLKGHVYRGGDINRLCIGDSLRPEPEPLFCRAGVTGHWVEFPVRWRDDVVDGSLSARGRKAWCRVLTTS